MTKPPFVITHKAVITRVGMLHFTSQLSSPVRVGVVGRSSSVAAAVARGAVGLRFLLRFGSV